MLLNLTALSAQLGKQWGVSWLAGSLWSSQGETLQPQRVSPANGFMLTCPQLQAVAALLSRALPQRGFGHSHGRKEARSCSLAAVRVPEAPGCAEGKPSPGSFAGLCSVAAKLSQLEKGLQITEVRGWQKEYNQWMLCWGAWLGARLLQALPLKLQQGQAYQQKGKGSALFS